MGKKVKEGLIKMLETNKPILKVHVVFVTTFIVALMIWIVSVLAIKTKIIDSTTAIIIQALAVLASYLISYILYRKVEKIKKGE